METYRLITANPGVIDSLSERPATGDGWRLTGDSDPDYLDQTKGQIFDPAGQLVAEVDFAQPHFRTEVMGLIRRHEAARRQPPPAETSGEETRPLIDVTRLPTGPVSIALWISGHGSGKGADEAFVVERGPKAMAEVRGTVRALMNKYPGAVLEWDSVLGDAPDLSEEDLPWADPERPEFVRCLDCGTIHRTLWQDEDPDRLHRQCDACFGEEFAPGPVDVVEEVPVVINPRLAGSARAETQAEDPETVAPASETASGDLETENRDPKPPLPPPEASESGEEFRIIPLSAIGHFPGGNQRMNFDPHKLAELAESIREVGIIQPLIVNERQGQFTLIAGERRLRAAGMAGLTEVPCRVLHLTDEQAQEAMLIENLQREDLNPMEEAQAYRRLLGFDGATQASVAKRVGKSRPHVVEYLQLLELPAEMARQVAAGKMAVKAALQFLRETRAYPDTAREFVARAMVQQMPSTRDAGKVIERALTELGVARATSPQRESTSAKQEAAKDTRPAPQTSTPTTPPAVPPAAQDVQTSSTDQAPELTEIGGQMYLADAVPSPEPAQRSNAESDLAQIGRRHWNETLQARTPYVEVEVMLTVEQIHAHWKERLGIKGYTGAGLGGTIEVQIPEQGVVFRGRGTAEVKQAVQYKPEELQLAPGADGLIVQCAAGRVQTRHTGGPVYYRAALYTSPAAGQPHGGHKLLHQQVVIPDGNRHIVVSGSDSVQIQAEQIPALEAVVRQLQAS